MNTTRQAGIINDYLARLEQASTDIPGEQRAELLQDIREHIEEARVAMPDHSDAALLTMLDRIGDPAVLAQEERERLGIRPAPPARAGILEIGALVFMLLFWPVGIVLLWASSAWSTRDKWIGTLLPPGGYFTVLFVGFGSLAARKGRVCSSGSNFVSGHRVTYSTCGPSTPTWEAVLFGPAGIVILLLPLLTTIYLGIRLRRAAALNNSDVLFGALAAHQMAGRKWGWSHR